jgi:lipopolysaccharide heptosyltransferase II
MGVNNPRFNTNPKNVLFIELAEMGSIVVAYPAIKELEKTYQDANIYFLSFENIRESIELLNIAQKDKVFTISNKSTFSLITDTLRFIYLSRKKKIDTVIILDVFVRYSAILGYLSGARKRVGFFRYHQEGLYIGNFLTHKINYNTQIHTSQSFLSLVRSLEQQEGERPFAKFAIEDKKLNIPRISSPSTQRENIWQMLESENSAIDPTKKLVIINPNASKLISIRKWPLENYAELAKKLLYDEELHIIITGLESEKSDAEYIRNYVKNDRLLDLTGKTSLKDLIQLINISHVLITNDSGPAHLASLTNTPIVVFFGPESPNIYKPLAENCTVLYSYYACSPCVSVYNKRLSPCNDNVCLKAISVEYVYETVRNILYKHTLAQQCT